MCNLQSFTCVREKIKGSCLPLSIGVYILMRLALYGHVYLERCRMGVDLSIAAELTYGSLVLVGKEEPNL